MSIFKKWLAKKNWNAIVQEICALLIGLGIGLYAYESKAALIPLKWKLDNQVQYSIAEETPQNSRNGGLLQRFLQNTGANRYLQNLPKFREVMDNLGIRGKLRNRVDSLMRDGVEVVPQKWKSPENQPFVIAGIAAIIAAFFIKILIYLRWLDFNVIKMKILAKKKVAKKKQQADWNNILQEFGTLGISVVGGIYFIPTIEGVLKGEETSLPYPLAGFLIFSVSILLKIAVHSGFIGINQWLAARRTGRKYSLFSIQRFRQFSKAYNWNNLIQGITAVIIGIGLGIYAYDSNLALVPMKWSVDREVAQDVAPPQQQPNAFQRLFGGAKKFWEKTGADRYLQNVGNYQQVFERFAIKGGLKQKLENFLQEGVSPVPKKWKKRENLPYLITFLVIFILSIVIKFGIYFSYLDFNRIVKKTRKIKQRVPWSQVFQETANILLSATAGVYVEPVLDNISGQTSSSLPYPTAGPIVVGVCIAIKLFLHFRSQRTPKVVRKAPTKTSRSRYPQRRI